jgi:hypothetical protein
LLLCFFKIYLECKFGICSKIIECPGAILTIVRKEVYLEFCPVWNEILTINLSSILDASRSNASFKDSELLRILLLVDSKLCCERTLKLRDLDTSFNRKQYKLYQTHEEDAQKFNTTTRKKRSSTFSAPSTDLRLKKILSLRTLLILIMSFLITIVITLVTLMFYTSASNQLRLSAERISQKVLSNVVSTFRLILESVETTVVTAATILNTPLYDGPVDERIANYLLHTIYYVYSYSGLLSYPYPPFTPQMFIGTNLPSAKFYAASMYSSTQEMSFEWATITYNHSAPKALNIAEPPDYILMQYSVNRHCEPLNYSCAIANYADRKEVEGKYRILNPLVPID